MSTFESQYENWNTSICHLIEFKKRVLFCVGIWFVVFIGLFCVDDKLYTFIAKPLLTQLPAGSQIIATEVSSTFMVPMKLAWVGALIVVMPYLLYQLWAFVAPGLYKQERKTIFPLFIFSILLFYLGLVFAYTIICPLALGFFAKSAPVGVSVMTDIRAYLDFVLSVVLSAGFAFQVPVVMLALIQAEVVTVKQLAYLRPYVIVGAFIVGMLLTPPDVVSQVLLALPMWGLFELVLLLAFYKSMHAKKSNPG